MNLLYFQISFFLPVEAIPARMGFLVTLMLCTVNIFNSADGKYPPNANTMIQWILACLLFIIMAMLEYTFLLGYNKYRNPQEVQQKRKTSSTDDAIYIKKMSNALDKWMLVIFPPTFTIFALVFWMR